jgi:hypothetical protein
MCYHKRLLLPLLLILPVYLAGCVKPSSVSYEAAAVRRATGGKITVGTKVGPLLAPVSSVAEIENDGRKVTVQVREIHQDKAIFEVTYPDGATELIEMRRGESKDFLPAGKELGIHLHVKEVRS